MEKDDFSRVIPKDSHNMSQRIRAEYYCCTLSALFLLCYNSNPLSGRGRKQTHTRLCYFLLLQKSLHLQPIDSAEFLAVVTLTCLWETVEIQHNTEALVSVQLSFTSFWLQLKHLSQHVYEDLQRSDLQEDNGTVTQCVSFQRGSAWRVRSTFSNTIRILNPTFCIMQYVRQKILNGVFMAIGEWEWHL